MREVIVSNSSKNNIFYTVTTVTFSTAMLIRKMDMVKPPWQILTDLLWLLVDIVQTQTRLKPMTLQPTHGREFRITRIMNSKFAFHLNRLEKEA